LHSFSFVGAQALSISLDLGFRSFNSPYRLLEISQIDVLNLRRKPRIDRSRRRKKGEKRRKENLDGSEREV